MGKNRETDIEYKQAVGGNEMSERPKGILCFDNYPEAKMALGKLTFPVVIKPYASVDSEHSYEANDYGKAIQVLYDAFEYSKNGWVVIEFY